MAPTRTTPVTARNLIFAWSLWLLVSWAINLAIDGPASLNSADGPLLLSPVVRWMMLCAMLGVAVAWPLWRLSTKGAAKPGSAVLGDLWLLWLMLQVVIWPMRMLTHWPLEKMGYLELAVVCWWSVTGLWVYLGLLSRRSIARMAAMALCLATLGLGPVIEQALGATPSLWASPLSTIWWLADPLVRPRYGPWLWPIVGLAVTAALAGMAAALAVSMGRKARQRPGKSGYNHVLGF